MAAPTPQEIDAAKTQLNADYGAVIEAHADKLTGDMKRDLWFMFCMGGVMSILSLRGFVEDPENTRLLPHMSEEECVSAYFAACQLVLRAN